MRNFPVTNFKHGIITAVEPQTIPDGASSNSLNWLSSGDHIELGRGSRVIGTEVAGIGHVKGLHKGYKADGSPVWFCSYGLKVFYTTNITDGPWTEIGTNILDVAEDIYFANYASLAGNQVWFCSPNNGLFKIMTANPASYTNMYSASRNFKGILSIRQNRMWMWGMNNDKTGVYGSYIDTANYTTVTGEATASLSGTLGWRGINPLYTGFAVVITLTVSGEVYTDNYSGTLTGSLGGTGTINYTTGAYTLSNAGVGTATYQWENSNDNGISDFTKSATRLAGEGFVFRQDDGGGDMKSICSIGNTEYCFHEFKTWALTLTADDTNATNVMFRENVGIPYPRASISTGQGIYYIDVTDQNKPAFRRLVLDSGSTEVVPRSVTDNVNLEGYTFDQCCFREWDDYILFAGRTNDESVNNRVFAYNKTWNSIDILPIYASILEIGNGELICGESISNNVVTLFSGFDDSDALLENYWEGNISELGISGYLKRVKSVILEGNIQANQGYDVYVETDHGGYSLIGSISGSGAYVDYGQAITVGSYTVGSKEIGGGGDGVEAYHYLASIPVRTDKFESRRFKFVATGIGYVSITKHVDHDIRTYAQKIPRKYL